MKVRNRLAGPSGFFRPLPGHSNFRASLAGMEKVEFYAPDITGLIRENRYRVKKKRRWRQSGFLHSGRFFPMIPQKCRFSARARAWSARPEPVWNRKFSRLAKALPAGCLLSGPPLSGMASNLQKERQDIHTRQPSSNHIALHRERHNEGAREKLLSRKRPSNTTTR